MPFLELSLCTLCVSVELLIFLLQARIFLRTQPFLMCPTDESRGHLCSRFSPRECALAFRHCYRSSTLTFLQVDFLDGLSMCAHRIQTGTQTCEGRPVPTQRSPFLLAWSLWREPISLAALWQMDAFPLAYHHPFVSIFSRSRFLARRFQMARP